MIAQVEAEMAVLTKYLPEQLSEDKIRDIVTAVLSEMTAPIKMGDVMAKVMPQTKGRADGKLVNAVVRQEIAKING